jgi:hypothetical protein
MVNMITNEQYQKMLVKLDEMYNRETDIQQAIIKLKVEYEQLQEDKELLQTMIMHQMNTIERKKKMKEAGGWRGLVKQ